MKTASKILLTIVFGLIAAAFYCLFLALPIMFVTEHLHDQGWPITPLGYWASWWTAWMFAWFINSAVSLNSILDRD